MRVDTFFFIVGYIIGNPKARDFLLKIGDAASKAIDDKYKELKESLSSDNKEKNNHEQIL